MVTGHGPVATADDELDGGPDLGKLDVHVLENSRRNAFALADEAQEQVLRADVVVVEALRFVLRQCQDFAGPIRELVEAIHEFERLFPCERLIDAPAMLARCPSPASKRIGPPWMGLESSPGGGDAYGRYSDRQVLH